MKTKLVKILKKASITFYNSSMFFPEDVRSQVVILYAYVRKADNFVDGDTPDKSGILKFQKDTLEAFQTGESSDEIISEFIKLAKEKQFDPKWVDAFLQAMLQDLHVSQYATYRDLQKYMYGSAEVVGLMMSRILELQRAATRYARYQGEAYQLINFIRDIGDDLKRNRVYIPQEDLRTFGIKKLDQKTKSSPQFEEMVLFEIDRFLKLQQMAEKGYQYIPRKYLIPIKTASDMFIWTANEIKKNPSVVLNKQVKPSAERVKIQFMKNMGGTR